MEDFEKMTKKFLMNDPQFLPTEDPKIVDHLVSLGFDKKMDQQIGPTRYVTDEDWFDDVHNVTTYIMTHGKVVVQLQRCEHKRYSSRFSSDLSHVKQAKKAGYTPTSWEVALSTNNQDCDGHLYTVTKETRFVESDDVDGMMATLKTTIDRCNEKIDHHRKRYLKMIVEADEIQKDYGILVK